MCDFTVFTLYIGLLNSRMSQAQVTRSTVSKLSLNEQLFEHEGSVAEWSACRSRSDHYLDLFLGSPEFKFSATLDQLAQWVEHREVANSNLGRINTQGL